MWSRKSSVQFRIGRRYGADGFMYGIDDLQHIAIIQFRVVRRAVKFVLPLPTLEDKSIKTDKSGWNRSEGGRQAAYDQAMRQRWRAMLLCIKSKLETIATGITTFEQEFLTHLVMPDGRTVGEQIIPEYIKASEAGSTAPLMLGI